MLTATEMNGCDALEFPMVGDTPPTVGGFVLGDSFDGILRSLSPDYLARAFENVLLCLEEAELKINDLGWGWMHPGHTWLPDTTPRWWPSDYLGWTSPLFGHNWTSRTVREKALNARLQKSSPSLRSTSTYRGRCHKKLPQDFALGVRFIQCYYTCEVSDWHPNVVLEDKSQLAGRSGHMMLEREALDVWQLIALALYENDQRQLDEALDLARNTYSLDGLRLLWRGYRYCIESGSFVSALRWPEYPI